VQRPVPRPVARQFVADRQPVVAVPTIERPIDAGFGHELAIDQDPAGPVFGVGEHEMRQPDLGRAFGGGHRGDAVIVARSRSQAELEARVVLTQGQVPERGVLGKGHDPRRAGLVRVLRFDPGFDRHFRRRTDRVDQFCRGAIGRDQRGGGDPKGAAAAEDRLGLIDTQVERFAEARSVFDASRIVPVEGVKGDQPVGRTRSFDAGLIGRTTRFGIEQKNQRERDGAKGDSRNDRRDLAGAAMGRPSVC